jgi:hypothetical protein
MPMTNRVLILASVLSTSALVLTSCGRDKAPTVVGQGADPLLAHALAGPLMTDPDLASRNRALAGITGGGPEVIELPLFENYCSGQSRSPTDRRGDYRSGACAQRGDQSFAARCGDGGAALGCGQRARW